MIISVRTAFNKLNFVFVFCSMNSTDPHPHFHTPPQMIHHHLSLWRSCIVPTGKLHSKLLKDFFWFCFMMFNEKSRIQRFWYNFMFYSHVRKQTHKKLIHRFKHVVIKADHLHRYYRWMSSYPLYFMSKTKSFCLDCGDQTWENRRFISLNCWHNYRSINSTGDVFKDIM